MKNVQSYKDQIVAIMQDSSAKDSVKIVFHAKVIEQVQEIKALLIKVTGFDETKIGGEELMLLGHMADYFTTHAIAGEVSGNVLMSLCSDDHQAVLETIEANAITGMRSSFVAAIVQIDAYLHAGYFYR